MGKDYTAQASMIRNDLKRARGGKWVSMILTLAVGILLLAYRNQTVDVICRVIAGIVTAGGAALMLMFLVRKIHSVIRGIALVFGAVLVAAGVWFFIDLTIPARIFPYIVGLIIIVSGLMDLGEAVRLFRIRYNRWWETLVLAVLLAAMGVVLIVQPLFVPNHLFLVVGIMLIIVAAADLLMIIGIFEAIRLSKKQEEKAAEAAAEVSSVPAAPEVIVDAVKVREITPDRSSEPEAKKEMKEVKEEDGKTKEKTPDKPAAESGVEKEEGLRRDVTSEVK